MYIIKYKIKEDTIKIVGYIVWFLLILVYNGETAAVSTSSENVEGGVLSIPNEVKKQQRQINLIQLEIDQIRTLLAKVGNNTLKIQKLPHKEGSNFNITLKKVTGTAIDDLSQFEIEMEFEDEDKLRQQIQSHLMIGKGLSNAIYSVLRDMAEDINSGKIHPIQSRWGPWTQWTLCNTTKCGDGLQFHERQCINVEHIQCEGPSKESKHCHIDQVNCNETKKENLMITSATPKYFMPNLIGIKLPNEEYKNVEDKNVDEVKVSPSEHSISTQAAKPTISKDQFKDSEILYDNINPKLTRIAENIQSNNVDISKHLLKNSHVQDYLPQYRNQSDNVTNLHHSAGKEWSACSVSCGEGVKIRQLPDINGKTIQETATCVLDSCDTGYRDSPKVADEGDYVKLHCTLENQSFSDQVNWTNPKGQFIATNQKYKISNYYLYVLHTSKSDKGTYHCVVLGKDGKIKTADATLNVRSCADQSVCNQRGHCIEVGYTNSALYDHFTCNCDIGFKGKHCDKGVIKDPETWQIIAIVLLVVFILVLLLLLILHCLKSRLQHTGVSDEKENGLTSGNKETFPQVTNGEENEQNLIFPESTSDSDNSYSSSDENNMEYKPNIMMEDMEPSFQNHYDQRNQPLQQACTGISNGVQTDLAFQSQNYNQKNTPDITQRIIGTKVSSLERFDKRNPFFSGLDTYYSCTSQEKQKGAVETEQNRITGAMATVTGLNQINSDIMQSRNNNANGGLPHSPYSMFGTDANAVVDTKSDNKNIISHSFERRFKPSNHFKPNYFLKKYGTTDKYDNQNVSQIEDLKLLQNGLGVPANFNSSNNTQGLLCNNRNSASTKNYNKNATLIHCEIDDAEQQAQFSNNQGMYNEQEYQDLIDLNPHNELENEQNEYSKITMQAMKDVVVVEGGSNKCHQKLRVNLENINTNAMSDFNNT